MVNDDIHSPNGHLRHLKNSSPVGIMTEKFTNLRLKLRSYETKLYSLPFHIVKKKRHAHEITKYCPKN